MERKLPKETLVKSLKNPESTHYQYAKSRGVNPKEIDWDSLLDSELDGAENWAIVKEEVKKRMPPEKIAEEDIPSEAEIEQMNKEMEKKYREGIKKKKEQEMEEHFKNVEEERDLSELYGVFDNYIECVAEGIHDALMIEASHGLGKTYRIKKILTEEIGADKFESHSGYSTPMEFYKFLYENKDKIVFIDDIEGLIKNKRALAILKQATWTAVGDTREVTWSSSSGKMDDAPSSFPFTGRIIMCFNEVGDDAIVNSLKDRCFFHKLEFTYEEKIKLITEVAGRMDTYDVDRETRMEIAKWIKDHTDPTSQGLNLRTLEKAVRVAEFKDVKSDEWEAMVDDMIDRDEMMAKVLQYIRDYYNDKYETKKDAIDDFKEEVGKSRAAAKRMFYRKQDKLEENSEIMKQLRGGE